VEQTSETKPQSAIAIVRTKLFEDRRDAGAQLIAKVKPEIEGETVVLALPRGGVPVAAELSRYFEAPLFVLAVRKLGAPHNPEFGIGAIAPGGVKVLDRQVIAALELNEAQLQAIEITERAELERRQAEYDGSFERMRFDHLTVLLVDDGLATGVTAQAAIMAVLKKNPKKVVLAIPVCAKDSLYRIKKALRFQDNVVCLRSPSHLTAVGAWYKRFDQVGDEEVKRLLKENEQLLFS
jgi:putative phosphoribosyl transferase